MTRIPPDNPFTRASLRMKVATIATILVIFGSGTMWFAFWMVTLQKAFAKTGFWPTLAAVTASVVPIIALWWASVRVFPGSR